MKQKKIILIKDTYISRMLFVLAATAVFGAILRPQVFPTLGTAEAVMRQSTEYIYHRKQHWGSRLWKYRQPDRCVAR